MSRLERAIAFRKDVLDKLDHDESKLTNIKDLMAGLSETPTLTKLLAFLKSLRELMQDAIS